MKSKKALALALVCALALSVLAGCTSGQQPSDTPGTSNDPGTNTNEPVDKPCPCGGHFGRNLEGRL